jgi:hypothetical protein
MKWFAAYLATVFILLIWNHARCLQMAIEPKSDQVVQAE